MPDKFSKRSFPIEELGKMVSVSVTDIHGSDIEISYTKLKLIEKNGQLCWFYASEAGNLIMPIARLSKIVNIMTENSENSEKEKGI
jgi:hypothetical protein